jgi:outer membrane translocation and assembly module TamA
MQLTKTLRFSFLVSLVVGSLTGLFAQQDSATANKRIRILPVPAIGYTPETQLYFGAVALFTINVYQDGITRTSNAKVEFNYTLNNQIIVETGWNYFFRRDRWFTRGTIGFARYPDYYWGIGAATQDSNEVRYQSNRVVIDFDVLKKINGSFFLGAGFRYLNYGDISLLEGTKVFAELADAINYGFRLVGLFDSRNNILTPLTGTYFELAVTPNFGSYNYTILQLDIRKYWLLNKKRRSVLAGRILQESVLGTPPFYDYALLGGDRQARGYFFGRFRDQFLGSVQLEYRQDVWWRLGFAVFGGINLLHADWNLEAENLKPNAGIGLRFLVDKTEGTNLRLDYAVGQDGQQGFYISFGESF